VKLYIDVIKYAINQPGKFKLGQMVDDLKISEENREILIIEIQFKRILASLDGAPTFHDDWQNLLIWASAEDHFRLIEYIELQEARASSQSAKNIAIFAIWLSIISLITSISLTIYYSGKPINISDELQIKINNMERNISYIQGNVENIDGNNRDNSIKNSD